MSSDPSTLLTDSRTIKAVWSDAPDEVGATVGYQGVTRIVAYGEPGQFCLVPWFAVYKGDVLAMRLNGAHMAEVRYVEPPADQKKT